MNDVSLNLLFFISLPSMPLFVTYQLTNSFLFRASSSITMVKVDNNNKKKMNMTKIGNNNKRLTTNNNNNNK